MRIAVDDIEANAAEAIRRRVAGNLFQQPAADALSARVGIDRYVVHHQFAARGLSFLFALWSKARRL